MRDVVTTLLEVVGLALLAAAAAVGVAAWSLPAGLAVGGAGLVMASAVIERPWPRRRGRSS